MKQLLEGLKAEAEAQRAELDADPRWHALAEGTISPDDDRALRALAETSEEARVKYELLAPISPEARAVMADRVLATLPGRRSPASDAARPDSGPTSPVIDLAARTGRTKRRATWLASGLALAASLMFAVRLLPGSGAPLPGYAVELTSAKTLRSSTATTSAEVHRLQRGARFELILRPERPVEGPIAVRAYFERGADRIAWAPTFEEGGRGSVRVRGPVDALPVGVGAWTLVVIAARPEHLGRGVEAPSAGSEQVVVRAKVDVVPAPAE